MKDLVTEIWTETSQALKITCPDRPDKHQMMQLLSKVSVRCPEPWYPVVMYVIACNKDGFHVAVCDEKRPSMLRLVSVHSWTETDHIRNGLCKGVVKETLIGVLILHPSMWWRVVDKNCLLVPTWKWKYTLEQCSDARVSRLGQRLVFRFNHCSPRFKRQYNVWSYFLMFTAVMFADGQTLLD